MIGFVLLWALVFAGAWTAANLIRRWFGRHALLLIGFLYNAGFMTWEVFHREWLDAGVHLGFAIWTLKLMPEKEKKP